MLMTVHYGIVFHSIGLFWILLIHLFETGSHPLQAGLELAYMDENNLEPLILLPLPPRCRSYRHELLCLAITSFYLDNSWAYLNNQNHVSEAELSQQHSMECPTIHKEFRRNS